MGPIVVERRTNTELALRGLQRDRVVGARDSTISLAGNVSSVVAPRLCPSLFGPVHISCVRVHGHRCKSNVYLGFIQLLQKGPTHPPWVFFADAVITYYIVSASSCWLPLLLSPTALVMGHNSVASGYFGQGVH